MVAHFDADVRAAKAAAAAAPVGSVVIPAMNEGERLPGLLHELASLGSAIKSPEIEFIVVDDGSRPGERDLQRRGAQAAEAQLEAAGSAHRILFVELPINRGKGAAVREGWRQARADALWLGFLDADGSVSAGEFWRLAEMLCSEPSFDVLAGSRIRMASRQLRRSLFRHLQGRVFATMTEIALGLGFYDTQCGVKFFRQSILGPEIERLREDRWLLDLEVLGFLRARGARFREEPIDWYDTGRSKVRFGVDAAHMLWGLWNIKKRLPPSTR